MSSFTSCSQSSTAPLRWLLAIVLIALATGCSSSVADQPTPFAVSVGSATVAATAPATAAPTSPSSRSPTAEPALPVPTPGDAAADQAFSGQRALDDVQWLAETIGSRPAGSAGDRQAADGLAERLRRLGYDVALQPFAVRRFEDRGSALRLAEQPDMELDVRALLDRIAVSTPAKALAARGMGDGGWGMGDGGWGARCPPARFHARLPC